MPTIYLTLLLGILFSTLFSGCVTKNSTLACYKGKPSCVAQHINETEKCLNCYAII